MFNKLKDLNKLRSQASEMQKKLADEIITVEDGGVEIIINGNMEIQSVKIADIENKKKLENSLKNAVNSAVKKTQKLMAQKMMGGGLNLPGM
ncbi:YbaB/EbfC family nucleoid-associated protein [Candidatus Parcubacteria bacterium]|nr:YbaB/EbfC family nucleoid-associated protein [Candidatus Parcubacteria bacterium]